MVYFVIILCLIVKVPDRAEGQSEQLPSLLISLNLSASEEGNLDPPGETHTVT